MHTLHRSPSRILLAASALLYGTFLTLSIVAQVRNIFVGGRDLPQIEANQRLMYAANKRATDYWNEHIDQAKTPEVIQRQAVLNAEVTRLSAKQNALLSASSRRQNWSQFWSRLQNLMLIPLVSAAGWQYLQGRKIARRRQKNLCIQCGYDLTSNASGKCPECGLAIDAPGDVGGKSVSGEAGVGAW